MRSSAPLRDRGLALRVLYAAMGAFTSFTVCWILWGVVTPGDFFANGDPRVWLTIAAAAGIGGYASFQMQSRRLRIALTVAVLACLLFWIVARDGWWAMPPPSGTPR